jgi:hypothetical protein
MSSYSKPLTKLEKWNRIIWTILATGFNVASGFFCSIIFIASCFQFSSTIAIWSGIGAILYTAPAWIIWHCVYKKHGTRLLTFFLFINVLLIILNCVTIAFNHTHTLSSSTMSLQNFLIVLCVLCCSSLMIIQLRKTNKKLYFQKHYTDEYLIITEHMESSTSIEDLDFQFQLLVKQWPKLNRYSYYKYKIKKHELTD